VYQIVVREYAMVECMSEMHYISRTKCTRVKVIMRDRTKEGYNNSNNNNNNNNNNSNLIIIINK
jgi:hypothetical protein